MSSVGKISLDLNLNSKGFNKQIDGIASQTKSKFNTMSIAIGNILADMATKALASVGDFVKDSIEKGSELSELQNVVNTVFTTMSDKVESFAQNALDSYGLTEAQAKRMVGTFGAMSKSFGYTEQQAYSMSTQLAALTADVASFYNLNHDEAYTKMKSVFTGETESLKELGVVMTQSALDQHALQNGFGKTTSQMTEQEKVALRLSFVQAKLSNASGDFLRTQDQWANQTRILTGQFESLKAAIGQGLINVLTPVINVVNKLMSKLVQLANVFKSFTESLMGKSSSKGSPASTMADVADAASSASDSTSNVASSTEKAAKAAKKAQKSLMAFDQINRLNKEPDDSSSSSPSSSLDTMPTIDMSNIDKQVDDIGLKANKTLDNLIKKAKELAEQFKNGFKDGLGPDFENSIQRMKDHISGIKESVKNIFTDPKVIKSVNNYANKVAYALGQVAGSAVSIGMTIAENLLGGIDKYLEQNKDYIKNRLIGIFDANAEIATIVGNLTSTIAEIFTVFRSDEAKQCTADLIGIFSNSILGITQLFSQLGRDILNCIAKPIIDNKDKIKLALENTIKPIGNVLSTLNKSVKHTFEKIFEVYDEKIKPMFQNIADTFSSVLGTVLDAYNKYIAPVIEKLSTEFSSVWEEHIQPTIDKAIEFIGKVANAVGTLYKDVIGPFVNWLISTLAPILAPIIEGLGHNILAVVGAISDVIGGLFDVLGGLIDFIVGVFTGDWELAWEGVKSIFEGIWTAISGVFTGIWNIIKGTVTTAVNAIKGVIVGVFNGIKTSISTILNTIKNVISATWGGIKTKVSDIVNGIKTGVSTGFNAMKTAIKTCMSTIKTIVTSVFRGIWKFIKGIINSILGGIEGMVNGVIGGLNSMIEALNSLDIEIPDFVPKIGGEKIGFDIPTIKNVKLPRLAEGGYVKANQPQPVIIGDNKTQGEIVSPENKMMEVVIKALNAFFGKLIESGYVSQKGNGDFNDLVIPIYLDGTILDEVIVSAQQRRNLRSGGR